MSTEEVVTTMRRALSLDASAFEEVRDDASFTPYAAVATAVAIVVAGLGAWLFGETILDGTPDGWFVDTVILGSLFTLLLWLAGVVAIYVVISQVYRQSIAGDAIFRVCCLGFLPYILGALVFIPQIGFAFAFLSVALAFYVTVFGLANAFSLDIGRAVFAAAVGFAVLAVVLPLISGFPDNNFVTGIFVYSLVD